MSSDYLCFRTDLDHELPEPFLCEDYSQSPLECCADSEHLPCDVAFCGRFVCETHAQFFDDGKRMRMLCKQCAEERLGRVSWWLRLRHRINNFLLRGARR